MKKKTLKRGAIGPENTSPPNKLPKKKKDENPLKKELSNPQGLDFANQAGALMAQQSKIEMLPPKYMIRESTKPERITSSVKSESTKVLRCKANVFDITMQGRRSFTFEYEGTYHNPRFYAAKAKFSLKLVNKTGGTGYQMYSVTDGGRTTTHSSYGPVITMICKQCEEK